MDVNDLIVQTSDQEELEELAATTPTYWIRNASDIARRRAKVHVSSTQQHDKPVVCLEEARSCGSPPRKRRKLDDPPEERSSTIRLSPPGDLPDVPPVVDEAEHVEHSAPTRDVVTTQASTESPASSPDPLLLFTPPRQPTSPRTSNTGASPLGSPLTPVTSPARRASTDQLSFSQASSSRRSPPQVNSPPSPATQHALEQAQEAERARYSLRRRNAWQLKPYEYDKLIYKKQMRTIPDALVKVVSPPRPPRRRSRSAGARDGNSSDTEEYQAGEDEEDEETQARRRHKGKERAIDAEGEGEESEKETPPWLKNLLPESSGSDDDDDAIFGKMKAAKKQEEKERRRKRPKPFPMKPKDLQPEDSPGKSPHKVPSPARDSSPVQPRPRPRPRHRTPEPPPQPSANHNNASEVEDESLGPAPTWRRRRSVTFTSPVRNSASPHGSSPAPEDDFMEPWNNYHHMYDDEFARAQTPYHLTQLGFPNQQRSREGSEVPHPPTTPLEVIDLTSDSDGDGDPEDLSREPSASPPASGSELVDKKSKKYERDLKRMMPMSWINKQLATHANTRKRAPAARASASVERDSDEDRPLRPGESRKRNRRTLSSRSLEIRGDSESSDVDVPQQPHLGDADTAPVVDLAMQESSDETGLSSSEESVIEPIGHQPRPKYRPHLVKGGGSAFSDGSSSSSELSDHDVGRGHSLPRTSRKQRVLRDGEAEVDNSVDRMLSRTVYDKPRVKRRRRRHGVRRDGGGGGGARRSGGGGRRVHDYGGHGGGGSGMRQSGASGDKGRRGESGLRITTSGAKRYGAGRQTLLSFKPLSTPPDAEDSDVELIDPPPPRAHNEVQFVGDEAAKAKQKAAKLKSKQAGVYVFNTGNAQLLGGRAHAEPVTVDQEVAASRGPVLRDDQPSSSKSKVKHRNHRQAPKHMQTSTLTQLWGMDEQYEADGFVVPDAPLMGPPPAPSSQQEREVQILRHVTVDLDVHPLPAGIAFPNTTYLGHGWLHELVNLLPGTHDVSSPPSCSMFDVYLHPDMSIVDLCASLDGISDRLRNLILGGAGPADHESCHQWQTFFHALSQHVSWLLANAHDDEHTALVAEAESFTRRLGSLLEEPIEILPEDEIPNPLVLQALWSVLELSIRLAVDRIRRSELPDTAAVAASLKALVMKLWDFTFGSAAVSLDLTREGLAEPSISQQIAELWVCVLNFANHETLQTSFLPEEVTFWTTYVEVLQAHGLKAPQTDLTRREAFWMSIFTLCALSQFSIHGNSSMTPRLPPSWSTIVALLERAPLSKDDKADEQLTRRVIHKRDEYVRILVCRCLWLNLKWHWRLDAKDAVLVFNRLLEALRSRHFASLADEQSDFPAFLRHYNLGLLRSKNRSDTAFTLFLKMVVRAADDVRQHDPQMAESNTIPPKLKQLLALVVPLGSVKFNKAKPPTNHELSTLYNRFSAIAVAIYLEPTEVNLKSRLSVARRYVDFKNADDETRRACIRGAMHLAILLRHLGLALTDILAWLDEMTNVLIDEYQASDASRGPPREPRLKSGTVLSIQLLLGSIRRILEVSSMDPERKEHKYPDPALLQGAWIHRVFSTATNLSTIPSTGEEIRRLVQAFLDARGRVMPKPLRPFRRSVLEDSQESQDYGYDDFQLNFDDPYLQVALGDVITPERKENIEKDKVVCEIIDKHISPAIYRLVCKHFADPVYQEAKELSFHKADSWVDCWVGCANVVVQNGAKDWTFYLSFGPQSWERIVEPDWRRRIGLRFMYMVLQLDPKAYEDESDRFVDVLFASIATPNVTLEHEYASLLFSVDTLRHALFHELPLGPPGEDGDWHMKKAEFIEKRLTFLDVMLKNLASQLNAQARGNNKLDKSNNAHIAFVIGMLTTMKDICERYPPNTQARTSYVTFCKQISDILARYPAVSNHHRLATLMAWLRGVS